MEVARVWAALGIGDSGGIEVAQFSSLMTGRNNPSRWLDFRGALHPVGPSPPGIDSTCPVPSLSHDRPAEPECHQVRDDLPPLSRT
jgi:hypothetical protein